MLGSALLTYRLVNHGTFWRSSGAGKGVCVLEEGGGGGQGGWGEGGQ